MISRSKLFAAAFLFAQAVFGLAVLPSRGMAFADAPGPISTPSGDTYKVRAGDNLFGIARRLKVALATLLEANGLTLSSVILPGQQLVVPPRSASAPPPADAATPAPAPTVGTYTVTAGDYLAGIASRNRVTLKALLRANGLEASSTIHPGQVLALPPPTLPAPAPSTAPAARAGTNSTSTPTASAETSAADILTTYLAAQVGKPYEFNSDGPDTFDCSGLVVAAFRQLGIALPHQSGLLSGVGAPVDWMTEELRAGDLVFVFSSATPGQIGHVGIALDSSTWIQAVGTGTAVRIRPLPADDRIRAVRRVLTTP